MRVLLIEDNYRLAAVVRRGLTEVGHVVDVEDNGVDGETMSADGTYDAIILDVNLPLKDGFAVARGIRAFGMATPILMLTSRDTVEDTIAGLDAGADDYLRKPFVFAELHARLRSITRRRTPPESDILRVGDLTLDRATRKVHRGVMAVSLTARETAFLEYFMQNAGVVLTQTSIENALWEADRDTISNLIRVYVRRLRLKLSPRGEPELIHTVRGAGYRMAADSTHVRAGPDFSGSLGGSASSSAGVAYGFRSQPQPVAESSGGTVTSSASNNATSFASSSRPTNAISARPKLGNTLLG